jgi:hypothetical protein
MAEADDQRAASTSEEELATFIMQRVEWWRDHRDAMRPRWNEYYRLWRGFWHQDDKNKDSERARTIMPPLANAVEMTVAEMQESTFGNGSMWFDVSDDTQDDQIEDAQLARNLLYEDMESVNAHDSICATYLNGALFGTGIVKLTTEVLQDGTAKVHVDPVENNEFLIDPAARNVEEAFGCAHELRRPLWTIQEKQAEGIYKDVHVAPYRADEELRDGTSRREFEELREEDRNYVLITEYHGLVPKRLLEKPKEEDERTAFEEDDGIKDEFGETLVEAIVTIANERIVLKAAANPLVFQDRAFIAYQHETVPGRFWGRGVAEKGYNPQKAFDAEHRMRIDAMAYTAAPMFMYNMSALGGKRFRLNPRPGRQIPVSGTMSLDQVVRPVDMGATNPATFNQTAELEKMIHLGTGAMDISGFAAEAASAETATGASVGKSVFVKRAKLVQKNVERNFLIPLIKKSLFRYIQFDKRYPKQDVKFVIDGALGMVAREMEQQSLVQMIGLMEQGSLTQKELVRSFVESSSHPNRARIIKALEADAQPNPAEQEAAEQQKQLQQLQMERMSLENNELKVEIQKLAAQIKEIMAGTMVKVAQAEQEDDKISLQRRSTMQEDRRLDQEDERMGLERQRMAQEARKTGAN